MDQIRECPFCIHSKVIEIKTTQFLKCRNCGLYLNKNSMSGNEIKKGNKNFMLSTCSATNPGQSRLASAYKQLDVLEKYTTPGIVYDVGAAAGFFLKAAADRGWEVYGNEISKSAIKWAKSHYGIDIEYGFLEELNPEKNFYNAVVLWNTLEHTVNPYQTLKIIKQMLKKDGLIYIRIPIKSTAKELNKYYAIRHIFEFPARYLSDFLYNKLNFAPILICPYTPENGAPYTDYLFRKRE